MNPPFWTSFYPASTRRLAVAPYPVSFWYRQSGLSLLPPPAMGRVAPPATVRPPTGDVAVELDLDGRLLGFAASPIDHDDAAKRGARASTWPDFFEAAHLAISEFTAVEPESIPFGPADTRIAWKGDDPGPAKIPVRVEAAAFNVHPVAFKVQFPWSSSMVARSLSPVPAPPLSTATLGVALILIACFLARRNWEAGRGDARGALIVALFTFATTEGSLMLGVHEPSYDVGAQAFLPGLAAGISYLAFEPWVRRRWPQALVTSSRVLAGRWRDPVVGRDILIGIVTAVGTSCFRNGLYFWCTPMGTLTSSAFQFGLEGLMGARFVASAFSYAASDAMRVGFGMFFYLFLCRVLLRKPALGTIGSLVLMSAFLVPSLLQGNWIAVVFNLFINTVSVLIMVRFGLLTLTVWAFFGIKLATTTSSVTSSAHRACSSTLRAVKTRWPE